MPWSRKQLELLNLGGDSRRFHLVWGPVRSGKTRAGLAGFLAWSGQNFSDHTFLLVAKTMGQIRDNLIPIIDELSFEALGQPARYVENRKCVFVGTNRYLTYEGLNEASSSKLQGLTLSGAYIDEATTVPRSFADEVIARCSVPGAKIVMSANPEGPNHWLKINFVDRAEEIGAVCYPFELADNPTLSRDYALTLKATTSGVFLRRRYYGEWAAASGLIFPEVHVGIPPAEPPYAYELAVDAATSSVTHALLVGVYALPTQQAWILREWRHDGRVDGQIADSELADGIAAMVKDHSLRHCVIDPHALSLRAELRRRLKCPVSDALNDVLPGIQFTAASLAAGSVRISAACSETIREMGGYQWDEDAAEKGEDKPVKADDHAMDALRYWVYSRSQRKPRRIEVK